MQGEGGGFASTTERGATPRIPLTFQFSRIDTPRLIITATWNEHWRFYGFKHKYRCTVK
jgi:hypothetical protein